MKVRIGLLFGHPVKSIQTVQLVRESVLKVQVVDQNVIALFTQKRFQNSCCN